MPGPGHVSRGGAAAAWGPRARPGGRQQGRSSPCGDAQAGVVRSRSLAWFLVVVSFRRLGAGVTAQRSVVNVARHAVPTVECAPTVIADLGTPLTSAGRRYRATARAHERRRPGDGRGSLPPRRRPAVGSPHVLRLLCPRELRGDERPAIGWRLRRRTRRRPGSARPVVRWRHQPPPRGDRRTPRGSVDAGRMSCRPPVPYVSVGGQVSGVGSSGRRSNSESRTSSGLAAQSAAMRAPT
jgi:hypothetical protein